MSSELSSQTRNLLAQHSWETTIRRLTVYAAKEAARLYWRGIYGGPMIEGKEAGDLVHISILKVLSGQRQWDPTTHPDLFDFLRSIVNSELNHLAESWENRQVQSDGVSWAEDECGDKQETSLLETSPDIRSNPEQILAQKQEDARADEFFWGFYEFLEDEPLLRDVIACIEDDIEKPADISVKLGIPVQQVYNARKQLQRRIEEYRKSEYFMELPQTPTRG
jgi:hypothetical protein